MSISKHGKTEIKWVGVALGLLLFVCRPAIAQSVEYIHTDALGTPVAVTDADRNVLETSELEPFGKLLNRPLTDEPGYTGHVSDAATGLSYMQQRYCDPGIGRFLSVDPVTADGNSGGNFNRYWYANDNPYRFTDPDGRDPGDPNTQDATADQSTNRRASTPGPGTEGGIKSQYRVDGGIAGSLQNTRDSGGGGSAQGNGNGVYAVHDGSVRTVGWQNPQKHNGQGAGAGYRVQIDEGNGQVRIYGHMDPTSIDVDVNDSVAKGQRIGDYANPTNGHSSGPHVHVQLMDFSSGTRRDVDPGLISPLGGEGGHVTTPFGVRDAMHPNAHQGTDWAY